MIRKIVLTICLSSLLMGCFTAGQTIWYIPPKPKIVPVAFVQQKGGFFIETTNAVSLANNIDEMKAYERKMDLLIKAMAKAYNIKLEEYK